ncbi:MAG: type V CRISPR-associated protein C2c8 [Microcoleaceae cyanobacterium]
MPWIVRGKTGESLPLEARQPYCPVYDSASRIIVKSLPDVKVYTPQKDESAIDVWKRIKNPERAVVSVASTEFNYGWVGGWGYSCPISGHRSALVDLKSKTFSKEGLGKLKSEAYINKSNYSDEIKRTIKSVHSKFRGGTLNQLITSWNEYIKSRSKQNDLKRGKPKYKCYRDRIKTIVNDNPNAGEKNPASKDDCRIVKTDVLRIPGFGEVKIKGLSQRWISDREVPRVKTVKILNRPSGWYIQLTGEFKERDRRYKQSHGAIGIDAGWSQENWITTDRDCTTKPRWYREGEEKLAKLQRQLDGKKAQRLILWLNHSDNSIERMKQLFPYIARVDLEKIRECKTSESLQQLVSEGEVTSYIIQRLKHYNFKDYKGDFCMVYDYLLSETKREWELKKTIACHHEKLKRRRRAHNQKRSTWLTRKYDVIRVEDGLQMTAGRAKTKVSEDRNQFEKNNQSSRIGMNKSLLDAAHGNFLQLLEDKSNVWERNFERLKPGSDLHPVTKERIAPSQMCPVCDHKNTAQKDIGKKDFNCEQCGYIHHNRDRIPGLNFIIWAYIQGDVTDEQLSKEGLSILQRRNCF